VSSLLRIEKAVNDRPTSAIYSCSPTGGELKVEASGIRMPRGLAFYGEYAIPYATNNGMELRGTRPVKDDPDALLKIIPGTWYGWPDYSTDLVPISDPRFQPPLEMISRNYPELAFLIDQGASSLTSPAVYSESLLFGTFKSLSGAAKMDFAPDSGAFGRYRGSAIVALSGDRAPYATSGQKLLSIGGYKIVRVDLTSRQVFDFIRNTEPGPASKIKNSGDGLERPMDVKFGPDGKLYVLDYGRMEVRGGHEKVAAGTGRILVLEPVVESTTKP
jgi:glucose/arabinose dehydrogenase